ncbi:ketoacyl-ACP synthase III [Bacillus pseudomycoides]|uniref:Beta-ketoacyl-[acyl-carrier-protein] synthase III n=1 Tax=Bacillus pseudomycoides TaxID=64104 RepID=A0A2B6RP14_9BACI|nr:ketoacyl-ACP synthase III [Bacillus pseudomycoides]PDY45981.1 ketoacyl-ACP synthase III [Bacillus pseudomycoides]PEA83432.1 ketoacyl-ACP synthase III [Bacillus pseudomycoides]PED69034.1 ketoacyl-ACP synthase III [Bacillus pseudomycoides]PEI36831.1 ketoacyl-ACP synthase III [Bacillus pseudomycoides]PEJ70153.1 ketoacyl-ACP synthase III [Bacillus pseudomycoides]
MNSKARITAVGAYVPEKILSNEDLSNLVETTDEWIVQRTGMHERRITSSDEFSTTLCIRAVQNLIDRFHVSIDDVDLIIVATATPDYMFPNTASQVQAHFEIPHTGAIDLSAACAGFVYGLIVANGLITSGTNKKILVIGAETLSKITNYSDRTTCILFGDGAGAALVEYDENNPSFLGTHMGSKGSGGINLYQTALSKTMNRTPLQDTPYLIQNGRAVYKWAVNTVPQGVQELLEKNHLNISNIDWFIPHSVNLRMIESICERTGISLDRTLMSLQYCGNTSAASIPLALDIGLRDGKINNGDTLLLYGFGGGLVHAGLILKWNI